MGIKEIMRNIYATYSRKPDSTTNAAQSSSVSSAAATSSSESPPPPPPPPRSSSTGATRSSSSTPATPTPPPPSPAATSSTRRSTTRSINPNAPPIPAAVLEEGLDRIYRPCRTNDKSVGLLEIRAVEAGTFEKLMDLLIAQGGASVNQYKTPPCVKSKSGLKVLNAYVSDCYFS